MTETTPLSHASLDRLGRQVGAERVTDQTAERAKIAELAQEFEAFVVLQMVRQMRDSVLACDQEGGFGAETMNDTIDVELARHLAAAGGFGLADVLAAALERQVGGASEGAAAGQSGGGPAIFDGRPARPTGKAVPPVALATATAAGTTTGGPAIPLPVSAPTTSPFGWRADPFGQGTRFHSGIDLAAAYGQAVPSVAPGRVMFAGEQRGYGLTVVVAHADGMTTRYGHLSNIDVRSGETVQEGTVVGRVGSTGRSTGPHLHFEVRVDGQAVDPERAASRYASLLKTHETDADSPYEKPEGIRVGTGVSDED